MYRDTSTYVYRVSGLGSRRWAKRSLAEAERPLYTLFSSGLPSIIFIMICAFVELPACVVGAC